MHGNGDKRHLEHPELFSTHADNPLEMLGARHLLHGAADLQKRVLKSHLLAQRGLGALLLGHVGHRADHANGDFLRRVKKHFGFAADPSHLAVVMYDAILRIVRRVALEGAFDLLAGANAILWMHTRQPLGFGDHRIPRQKTEQFKIPIRADRTVGLDIPIEQTDPPGFERV